jgi:hypothetical protein
MIAFPGIIKHLLTKSLIDDLLISIVATWLWGHVSIFCSIKIIMAPEGIIEGIRLFSSSLVVEDDGGWAFLLKIELIDELLTILTQHFESPFISLSLNGLTRTATLTLILY